MERTHSACARRVRSLARDEQGQALPIVTLMMLMLLACSGFAIDYSRSAYASRVLQETTDSAALAAAQAMPTASSSDAITGANGVVVQYSAASGEKNATSLLPSVSVDSTLLCLNTIKAQGIPCIGNVPYNAIKVVQSVSFPMYFWKVFGHPTMNLTSVSVAAIRGGAPKPSNVVVAIDSTLSMYEYDSNCGYTQMQCALNGFQVLLKSLYPCSSYMTNCNPTNGVATNSFDRVALFTFPNVSVGTASVDYSCTGTVNASNGIWYAPVGAYIVMPLGSVLDLSNAYSLIPTAVAYSTPSPSATAYNPSGASSGTYEITPFLSDYKTSDSATTLNSASKLTKAAGAVSGCNGMSPSNYDGVYGTYYAGAIYAAQAALTAEKVAYPDADNVLIILGDGDSTAPQTNYGVNVITNADGSGNYPSYKGECGQAITAAKAASAAGTLVYTVAYGAQSTGCSSDVNIGSYPNINPCDTMGNMATAPQMFYSDYNQSGSNSNCEASQPVTSLNDIFQSIANDLTKAHLIPSNTT